MEGARSILLSITGGYDMSLWEVNESAKAVAEAAHPDANIIFGAMVDEKLAGSGVGHRRRDGIRRWAAEPSSGRALRRIPAAGCQSSRGASGDRDRVERARPRSREREYDSRRAIREPEGARPR